MTTKPAVLKNEFVNRVVGSGEESPEQLLANPANFRIHPDFQQQSLAGSIDQIGYIDPVLVNKRTGMVIDGHLRVALALRSNVKSIPVTYVDLSEDEEKLALLSLDPIAAMAASDRDKLDELLHQVNSDDERVQQMLAEIAEREHLQYGEPPPEAPEAQIDRAEELRDIWKVELGQLWIVPSKTARGEHRVICGDCTDKLTVERAINGSIYNILADPPYNIGFNYAEIDDKMPPKEYMQFCENWYSVCCSNAVGSIVTPGPRNERLYPNPRDKGIWLKRYASAGASVFNLRCCEPIFFYGKFHHKRNFDWFDYSSGFTDDLRAAQRAARVEDKHPPAKPTELWKDLISMFLDGIIFDPFCGNGTSLVCCESVGRLCASIDITPAYVAVSLQRLADMGLEPRLIE